MLYISYHLSENQKWNLCKVFLNSLNLSGHFSLFLKLNEAASKETYFSLVLEKGNTFTQLFWLLNFTMVAKKPQHFGRPPSNKKILENVLFC